MDFTLSVYKYFLQSLISRAYSFVTFKDFIHSKTYLNNSSFIILRHDVDRLPQNSLKTAEIEYSLGIKGSYYFRVVPESFNADIIRKIAGLGHEIGYHYEDVDLVSQKLKVKSEKNEELLIDLAYESFCKNLEIIRRIADIKTVCMHGSPLSKFDNRIIWEKYNYRDMRIIGEPYLDIPWHEFAYFTDTGRRWNGGDVSIRDKVKSQISNVKIKFKTTQNIVDNIEHLPDKVMITVHPQRWNDKLLPWTTEYILQNTKNVIKKYFYVKNQYESLNF